MPLILSRTYNLRGWELTVEGLVSRSSRFAESLCRVFFGVFLTHVRTGRHWNIFRFSNRLRNFSFGASISEAQAVHLR